MNAIEYRRGDAVRMEGQPEYKQPFTVDVVYLNGRLKLSDKFGAPKISIDPARVEREEA